MKLGNKIEKIISINKERFVLKLKYVDGFIGVVDLSDIFTSPQGLVLEIIKGNFFEKCFIESGALAWSNGFELCPDQLKSLILNQKSEVA